MKFGRVQSLADIFNFEEVHETKILGVTRKSFKSERKDFSG